MTDRSLTSFEQVLLGLILDEPSSGYALKAFLTTTPHDLCQQVHDRMPVILRSEAEAAWLDPAVDGSDK